MRFEEQLDVYFRARYTLIVLVTDEEERAVEKILAACELTQEKRPCQRWDSARGVWDGRGAAGGTTIDIKSHLEKLMKASVNDRTVHVLHDFHAAWENPLLLRMLRSVAQDFRSKKGCVVITTPSRNLPDELREDAVVLDLPLPDENELMALLSRVTTGTSGTLDRTLVRSYIQAAQGLTSRQAVRAFSEVLSTHAEMNEAGIAMVAQSKKAILRETEALEYFSTDETADNVGGLDVLKSWLRIRERAFTPEALEYGLPAPKGVALIGIPGTGKSLTAKLVSSMWRMPLVRLDVGALFGSLLGESEKRLRRALTLAETVAPCVLWVDEIEKSLSAGDTDGGTSQRVLGTILNWMQETTKPIFIIATANDVTRMPPELLRKGRFDEIFFLDLPTTKEREEIFRVHLRRRRRNPENYEVKALARLTEGFVGAEIEQCVIDAMYSAFNDNQREFTNDDLIQATQEIIPLSQSQRERIEDLRSWLTEGRAKSASFMSKAEATQSFVGIIELPDSKRTAP